MRKKERIEDDRKNKIFVEAFHELRQNHGVKDQNDLADRMGVSNDTITRIFHSYTKVTEDSIAKLQNACGHIFNLQWLRGESNIKFAADVQTGSPQESAPEQSSMINALLAAKDDVITSLKRELVTVEESARRELATAEETARRERESAKRELAAKDDTITALHGQLDDKALVIETLRQQVADLRRQLEKSIPESYPHPVGAAERNQKNK